MKILRFLLIGFLAIVVLIAGFIAVTLILRGQKNGFPNEQAALENKLLIPPLLQPQIVKGEKVFTLTAQAGEMNFLPGQRTETMGYNGSYLGPTIRAHEGDKVRVDITNDLDLTTTVHWHGMHLPAAMDGGPHQLIMPGGTWQPEWTIANEAATLWYHPHQMGSTGEQVWQGLAGVFIIDDDNSDALSLPSEYGVDDIPLVVQDRKFDANGQFVYREHGGQDALPAPAGMIGDTIRVNGTHAPYVDVPRRLVRLRLVNASNGRRYNFGFSDGRSFYQIATDGGLLDAPVERDRVLLGAGERAEIVVDLTDATDPLTLMSYPVVGEGNGVMGFVRGFFGDDDEGQEFRILELRPQNSAAEASRLTELPTKLNSIKRLDEASATTTRQFVLDSRSINNKSMDPTRVDEVVKKGDVEIWQVDNQSPFYHVFHIHGFQFQVLDRGKTPTPSYEAGWKDTVIVNPGEKVRLIMQFTDYSDPTVPYMYHCHILEHEDMGMMGQFVVVDNLSDVVKLESPLIDAPDDMNMP
ncbi:MAG: multicopper oxidase domain-containing protein [Chloroflexota bacterium]